MNLVILRGCLSRQPEMRALKSGDLLVTYEVTVPGRPGAAAESVPVVWFDPPGGAAAGNFGPDEEVVVVGRVRRRFFKAGGTTQSRTEVVADRLLPARRVKAAERLVTAALADAEEAFLGRAA